METQKPLVLAIPKGRILSDVGPLMARAGIEPEEEFFDDSSRRLQFSTKDPRIDLVRVRSFDTATFLAFGAAHLAICGSDVLMEFDHSEIYAPVDLKVGKCRLSVAGPKDLAASEDPMQWSHLRIATKYPNITKKYFAERGVQAECIKLNGAMELAPRLGPIREVLFERIHNVPMEGQVYNIAHTSLELPPHNDFASYTCCLLYTSPSPRDATLSGMPA